MFPKLNLPPMPPPSLDVANDIADELSIDDEASGRDIDAGSSDSAAGYAGADGRGADDEKEDGHQSADASFTDEEGDGKGALPLSMTASAATKLNDVDNNPDIIRMKVPDDLDVLGEDTDMTETYTVGDAAKFPSFANLPSESKISSLMKMGASSSNSVSYNNSVAAKTTTAATTSTTLDAKLNPLPLEEGEEDSSSSSPALSNLMLTSPLMGEKEAKEAEEAEVASVQHDVERVEEGEEILNDEPVEEPMDLEEDTVLIALPEVEEDEAKEEVGLLQEGNIQEEDAEEEEEDDDGPQEEENVSEEGEGEDDDDDLIQEEDVEEEEKEDVGSQEEEKLMEEGEEDNGDVKIQEEDAEEEEEDGGSQEEGVIEEEAGEDDGSDVTQEEDGNIEEGGEGATADEEEGKGEMTTEQQSDDESYEVENGSELASIDEEENDTEELDREGLDGDITSENGQEEEEEEDAKEADDEWGSTNKEEDAEEKEDADEENNPATSSTDSPENSLDNTHSPATEGQVAELTDENTKQNWEGFDEDFSSPNKIEKGDLETTANNASGHDVSELNGDVQGYKGDGFRFHILHPKKGNKSSGLASPPFVVATVLLAALFLCICCFRYRRRRHRGRRRAANRGTYAALGSDDFFKGTFSDDISFRDKDSDDEMSFGDDYDEEEDEGMVKLEMGGIHEADANGGLTLDECNG